MNLEVQILLLKTPTLTYNLRTQDKTAKPLFSVRRDGR